MASYKSKNQSKYNWDFLLKYNNDTFFQDTLHKIFDKPDFKFKFKSKPAYETIMDLYPTKFGENKNKNELMRFLNQLNKDNVNGSKNKILSAYNDFGAYIKNKPVWDILNEKLGIQKGDHTAVRENLGDYLTPSKKFNTRDIRSIIRNNTPLREKSARYIANKKLAKTVIEDVDSATKQKLANEGYNDEADLSERLEAVESGVNSSRNATTISTNAANVPTSDLDIDIQLNRQWDEINLTNETKIPQPEVTVKNINLESLLKNIKITLGNKKKMNIYFKDYIKLYKNTYNKTPTRAIFRDQIKKFIKREIIQDFKTNDIIISPELDEMITSQISDTVNDVIPIKIKIENEPISLPGILRQFFTNIEIGAKSLLARLNSYVTSVTDKTRLLRKQQANLERPNFTFEVTEPKNSTSITNIVDEAFNPWNNDPSYFSRNTTPQPRTTLVQSNEIEDLPVPLETDPLLPQTDPLLPQTEQINNNFASNFRENMINRYTPDATGGTAMKLAEDSFNVLALAYMIYSFSDEYSRTGNFKQTLYDQLGYHGTLYDRGISKQFINLEYLRLLDKFKKNPGNITQDDLNKYFHTVTSKTHPLSNDQLLELTKYTAPYFKKEFPGYEKFIIEQHKKGIKYKNQNEQFNAYRKTIQEDKKTSPTPDVTKPREKEERNYFYTPNPTYEPNKKYNAGNLDKNTVDLINNWNKWEHGDNNVFEAYILYYKSNNTDYDPNSEKFRDGYFKWVSKGAPPPVEGWELDSRATTNNRNKNDIKNDNIDSDEFKTWLKKVHPEVYYNWNEQNNPNQYRKEYNEINNSQNIGSTNPHLVFEDRQE
jgi:hypothetical protein